ncbi:MAG TPA: deoxyribonuclease V [Nitrospiria bacterium]|nr:deoxyribonuclease V [Nitrospiria bacterium]
MKSRALHPWNLSPKEAVEVQRQLSARVVQKNYLKTVRFVAGADIALSKNPPRAYAGVVVLSLPDLKVVEECGVVSELSFPYIPGLLAFREAPALLKAFDRMRHEPDLLMIDGQGVAHPRGCGIACHIGLWLDKPTIGCAKSRLYGNFRPPPRHRGSWTPLTGNQGDVIGAVVRTKDNTNPIFVSVGHKIDLPAAIRFVLACSRGYRIPEPTRQADHFVSRLKRENNS